MKNTWLHSLVLVGIAAPVLALSLWFAADAPAAWREPVRALAYLAPGLVLGWFTRRHPLLVGAAAGSLAVVIAATEVVVATMLTASMVVAVAALAGRALRYRFLPDPAMRDAHGR